MGTVRHILDLDHATDARLRALAKKTGQDASAVVADALVLLESMANIEGPDIEEDLRRLAAFETTREAVPLEEVKAWVETWGADRESPPPIPRKVR